MARGKIKEPDVYTVAEVADILRISTSSVTKMIRDGSLTAIKIGSMYRIPRRVVTKIVNPSEE